MGSVRVSPSILAADFSQLAKELKRVESADLLHIDIMDGHFVPNITYGQMITECVKKHSSLPLDIHLMVDNPEDFIYEFAKLKPEYITVHYEACTHLYRILTLIKDLGCKAGVALNPHTPASVLEHVLEVTDLVLVMTVNPGFGGQQFIPGMIEKVKQVKHLINNRSIDIQVDGGVSTGNVSALRSAGVDIFVAGSSIFRSNEPDKAIAKLRELSSQ